jgi:hypothetical protein
VVVLVRLLLFLHMGCAVVVVWAFKVSDGFRPMTMVEL